MTAKEKLRERIEMLTEEQASEALHLFDLREDPVRSATPPSTTSPGPRRTRPPRPRVAPTSPPDTPSR